MHMRFSITFLMIVFFSLWSCAKPTDPQGVLKAFVLANFDHRSTSDLADTYFSGEMKKYFSSLSIEQREAFLKLEGHDFKSIKILSESRAGAQSSLTFIVKYSYKGHDVDVRKIAKLEKIQESWKIADVQTVKTYIEGQETINVQ
jgi:hypothetical protein